MIVLHVLCAAKCKPGCWPSCFSMMVERPVPCTGGPMLPTDAADALLSLGQEAGSPDGSSLEDTSEEGTSSELESSGSGDSESSSEESESTSGSGTSQESQHSGDLQAEQTTANSAGQMPTSGASAFAQTAVYAYTRLVVCSRRC